jgi:hypothetical protein
LRGRLCRRPRNIRIDDFLQPGEIAQIAFDDPGRSVRTTGSDPSAPSSATSRARQSPVAADEMTTLNAYLPNGVATLQLFEGVSDMQITRI